MESDPARRVTVYAGSSRGAPSQHLDLAARVGRAVAEAGWVLVYGGADVGLMGACADAALAAGGRVEGVILDTFSRVAHSSLDELEVVGDMRSRKAGLAHRGDAFCALPGGFGTLEELSEILVERQLGFHTKPVVLVDPGGFWQPLLAQFASMEQSTYLPSGWRDAVDVVADAADVVPLVAARWAQAPPPGDVTEKWR